MVMQYPILFPFGEDGFYIGIPYFNNEGRRKIKQEIVTMREYYAYRIQHRRNGGQTILCGGWLFQKFIVDAYIAIEEERLRFIRKKTVTIKRYIRKEQRKYGGDHAYPCWACLNLFENLPLLLCCWYLVVLLKPREETMEEITLFLLVCRNKGCQLWSWIFVVIRINPPVAMQTQKFFHPSYSKVATLEH